MSEYLLRGADVSHLEQSLGAVHAPDLPPADIHALSRMLQKDRDLRSGFTVLRVISNRTALVCGWELKENCYPRFISVRDKKKTEI